MTKQIKDKQSASMPKHDMSELVRREYVNFINATYIPTHYLVVRLPKHWETTNLDHAKSRLRLIMKVFERSLIKNHWNKHHLPFIVTAEKGCGIYWHFNVLFNHMSYNDDLLYNAIKKTIRTISGMSDYCLDLQHITADDMHTLLDSVINTDFYCLKEIKVNRRNGKYDSSVSWITIHRYIKDCI